MAALACWEAWHDSGSIAAAGPHGFLPDAVAVALLLALILASGATVAPRRGAAIALGLLVALAFWATISLEWSWVPSLARDEGMLTAYYAAALALPLVTLRTAAARVGALAALTIVLCGFTLVAAGRLAFGAHAQTLFLEGRLYFPITYANAQGALFVVAFWPAVLFATRRQLGIPARALGLAGAATSVTGATLAQSKGTTLGLLVSIGVVLAVSPLRLRLLVALGLCLAIEVVAFEPLTDPYRHQTLATVHTAGRAVLLAAVAGAVLGAVYAVVDRRVEIGDRARRRAGRWVAGAAVLLALAAVAAFFAVERHPVGFAQARWASFKHFDPNAGGATHLVALGSNRYDFWRVALIEFERHPLVGCGARCFGPAYLVLGRSNETPARAHSLPLELLGEQGIVGFALALGCFVLLFAAFGRGTRIRSVAATAALGGVACWLVQACVDWTWTFPALGVPAFLLAGIGAAAAGSSPRLLAPIAPRLAAIPVAAVAIFGFLPPWISYHLTQSALRGTTSDPQAALRWARRLDPVSTAPLVAAAELAPSSTDQITLLREAASREPRVLQTQYFYGSVLFNAGHREAARRVFEHAESLDPGNPAVARALDLVRAAP